MAFHVFGDAARVAVDSGLPQDRGGAGVVLRGMQARAAEAVQDAGWWTDRALCYRLEACRSTKSSTLSASRSMLANTYPQIPAEPKAGGAAAAVCSTGYSVTSASPASMNRVEQSSNIKTRWCGGWQQSCSRMTLSKAADLPASVTARSTQEPAVDVSDPAGAVETSAWASPAQRSGRRCHVRPAFPRPPVGRNVRLAGTGSGSWHRTASSKPHRLARSPSLRKRKIGA